MSSEMPTLEYILYDVLGNNGQIEFIQYAIEVRYEDKKMAKMQDIILETPIAGNTSHEELIEICKNHLSQEETDVIYETAVAMNEAEGYKEKYKEVFYRKAPLRISKLYARILLSRLGHWDTIKDYFNQPERTEEEKAFFEDATTWRRDDPLINNLTSNLLNMTTEEVDDLFLQAWKLRYQYVLAREPNNVDMF